VKTLNRTENRYYCLRPSFSTCCTCSMSQHWCCILVHKCNINVATFAQIGPVWLVENTAEQKREKWNQKQKQKQKLPLIVSPVLELQKKTEKDWKRTEKDWKGQKVLFAANSKIPTVHALKSEKNPWISSLKETYFEQATIIDTKFPLCALCSLATWNLEQ
jgi:hypothetical protein